MQKLLNSKTVCEILDISPATLNRMVNRKEIGFVLVRSGKTKRIVKFRQADVEAWIELHLQKPDDRHFSRPFRNKPATANSRKTHY